MSKGVARLSVWRVKATLGLTGTGRPYMSRMVPSPQLRNIYSDAGLEAGRRGEIMGDSNTGNGVFLQTQHQPCAARFSASASMALLAVNSFPPITRTTALMGHRDNPDFLRLESVNE